MSIEPIEAPAGFEMPETLSVDALVLPRETDDGEGLYDDSVVTVVKELHEAGASGEFLHDKNSRSWIGENAVAEIALALIVGIATNAGWAALEKLLLHRGDKAVEVKVARAREGQGGNSWEWFEAKGEGEAVAAAIKNWRAEADDGEET